MKRKDLLDVWGVLNRLESEKHDVRFSYFIAKNKMELKKEVDAINTCQTPSKEFLMFETKRVELAQQYSEKDDKGQPIVNAGQYVIIKYREAFEKEVSALKKQFGATLEERAKQLEECQKFLEEDIEFNFVKLKFEQLPKSIEPRVLEVFMTANMIMDEEK